MLSGWLKKTVRAWTKEALNLLFAPSSNNATYPAVASIGDAKVLVIMLTHLGDCVIYQPFLAGLLSVRREGETVHLLVKSGIEDLFSSCSRLTLWPFHCPWVGTGKWVDNARDWIRLIIDLRKSCFDIVIVTHPHFLTSLTARLIGAKYIVGFAEAGDQLLDETLPDCASDPMIGARRDLLMEELGIPTSTEKAWPYYDESRISHGTELAHAALLVAGNNCGMHPDEMNYLCIHPGAGGAQKIWPWQNFVRLVEQTVRDDGLPILLVGGRLEIELCKRIEAALSGQRVVVNLAGQLDVQALFGVLHSAIAYVGNDSGPSHLAASSGIPVLVIFGPFSNPDIWKPEGENVNIVVLPDKTFREEDSVAAVALSFQKLLDTTLESRNLNVH